MGALVGLGVGVGLLLVWSRVHHAAAPRARPGDRGGSPPAGRGRHEPRVGDRAGPVARGRWLRRCARSRSCRDAAGGLAFGAMAAYLPLAVVAARARRRHREFAEVWPEAVDNLASAVRAGLSLPDALAALGGARPLTAAARVRRLRAGLPGHGPVRRLPRPAQGGAGRPGRGPRGRGAAHRS